VHASHHSIVNLRADRRIFWALAADRKGQASVPSAKADIESSAHVVQVSIAHFVVQIGHVSLQFLGRAIPSQAMVEGFRVGVHYCRDPSHNQRAQRRAGKTRLLIAPWSAPFDDPIELPRGRQLVSLEDAGNYITELPKAEHMAPEWQDAMQILMLVAARGWPTMLARIGVLRAFHRNEERVFNRNETHRGKRKLKRDQ
jgi:hypothetical protein